MIIKSLQLALCLVLFSATSYTEVHLTFGVYTSDKPITMVKKFRYTLTTLENKLSEKLGEPVFIKTHVAKDYDQGIDDLVTGTVDFARFGPVSYVEAKKKNPSIGILAMESADGKKQFPSGVVIVKVSSSINSIQDIKGKKIAFGNKGSTIGRYLAQQFLAKHGIYSNDLGTFEYLDRHDMVGEAVGIGDFDVGFIKEGTFLQQRGSKVPIREIARFDNVTKPWLYSSKMSPRVMEALREVLLEIDDLKIIRKGAFIEGSDEDYADVRRAIETNSIFFKE